MADDKLNTNPQENTPPDIAALLGSDTPPEHEQAVISGMGEEAPAPAGIHGKSNDNWHSR